MLLLLLLPFSFSLLVATTAIPRRCVYNASPPPQRSADSSQLLAQFLGDLPRFTVLFCGCLGARMAGLLLTVGEEGVALVVQKGLLGLTGLRRRR